MVIDNVQRRDRTEVVAPSEAAAYSHPVSTTNENDTPTLEANAVDVSGWDNIWAEAYKKVKEDPKDATLLAKLELFLEKGGDTTGIGMCLLEDHLSTLAQSCVNFDSGRR